MEYIYIGKLLGAHGLKGEIKFKTDFKYIDKVLKKDFKLYLGDSKSLEVLNSYRINKDIYLLLFTNIDDIDSISKYINSSVYINKDDLDLKDNEYVIEDFLNKKAYFKDLYLGVITSVTDYGSSNYVITIQGDREILVPYNEHFIDKVSDNIYLKNMEGLIDEN